MFSRFLFLATLSLLFFLSGCANDTGTVASVEIPAPAASSQPPTTAEPTPTVDDADPATPDQTEPGESSTESPQGSVRIGLELVGTFDEPMALLARPGSDLLYLLERNGRVVPLNPTTGTTNRSLIELPDEVRTDVERGLLGGAFSPDGNTLYLHFSDAEGATQVDAWRLDGDQVDPTSRRNVLSVEQPFANHNGGQLATGPDGLLYLGLGDGGAANDPLGAGQDTTTLLGSVIRIDPTDGTADDPYAVPPDNPFVSGDFGDGADEIFLWGVRNPWRFSFDRETGDLWIADVGQDRLEEITVLRATDGGGLGANLGWALREGTEEFTGPEPTGHVAPIHEYNHDNGNCSVTGGYVYRGEAIPGLVGTYVYADYCVPELWTVSQAGEASSLGLSVDGGEVVSFGEDNNGELYVLSRLGQVFRLAVVES